MQAARTAVRLEPTLYSSAGRIPLTARGFPGLGYRYCGCSGSGGGDGGVCSGSGGWNRTCSSGGGGVFSGVTPLGCGCGGLASTGLERTSCRPRSGTGSRAAGRLTALTGRGGLDSGSGSREGAGFSAPQEYPIAPASRSNAPRMRPPPLHLLSGRDAVAALSCFDDMAGRVHHPPAAFLARARQATASSAVAASV